MLLLWQYAVVQHAGTSLDGDTLVEHYKFITWENNLLLFLFQQYCHNMKQQYQQFFHILINNMGHFQVHLLSKSEYWHLFLLQKALGIKQCKEIWKYIQYDIHCMYICIPYIFSYAFTGLMYFVLLLEDRNENICIIYYKKWDINDVMKSQ